VFALQRGTDWYYVATDFVGTPLAVFDATGRAVKVLEYDSYGVLLSDSNPSFELAVGFAGGLADEQTGLVRFGWRDYEPAAGRWTARDPLFFAGGYGNLYTYCANDPVNHIDPSGQLWYDKISDLLAGFGDTITTIPFTDWSLTRYLRKKIDVDDVVNPCSNQYKGGRFFGKVYKAAQWWNRINAFRAPLYPSAPIPQVPLGLRP
jgi:RHS repeat-associated protein